MGYAGENENESPEAEPDAPRGRSRINLRESFVGTRDLALVLVFEAPLLRAVLVLPAVTLLTAFEPAVALPAFASLKPPIQFAQARFDRGIDFTEIPQPVALDLEFVEQGLREDPIRLPVAIPLEDEFVTKVAMPLVGIILPLPFMNRNGPEWLLDFHELLSPTATAPKVGTLAHNDVADDGENRFEYRTIAPRGGVLAEHVEATPAALDGLIEFDDLVTPPTEVVVFADGSDHLTVREIA